MLKENDIPIFEDDTIYVVVALQVLSVGTVRCKTNGVDDGDPSAPRTEKSTAHDCVLFSQRNQAYHDPQSSQVRCASVCILLLCVCACVFVGGFLGETCLIYSK